MKTIKRILCAVICSALFLPCLSLLANAKWYPTKSGTIGELNWHLSNGELTISGNGSTGDFTFDTAPLSNESYTKIFIKEGVTEIGDYALYCSFGVEVLELPSSLRTIGEGAITNMTKLKELVIPEGVVSIGKLAFFDCEKTERISLPSTLQTVGDQAFQSVVLKEFSVSPQNKHFRSVDGVLFSADMSSLVQYPMGLEKTTYTIPAEVRRIRPYAFFGAKIDKVICSEGLETVEEYAFFGSGVRDVSLPSSLRVVEDYAFAQIPQMRELVFPDGVTTIGDDAFRSDLLARVSIPKSAVHLGNLRFSGLVEGEKTILCHKGSAAEAKARALGVKIEYLLCAEHAVASWQTVQASTCTAKGEERGFCPNCETQQSRELPLAEHRWSDFAVKKEASEEEEGLRERVCEDCSLTESEIIPKLVKAKVAAEQAKQDPTLPAPNGDGSKEPSALRWIVPTAVGTLTVMICGSAFLWWVLKKKRALP